MELMYSYKQLGASTQAKSVKMMYSPRIELEFVFKSAKAMARYFSSLLITLLSV